MATDPKVREVAEWLLATVQAGTQGGHRIRQEVVAQRLRATFGTEWTYRNPNGNLAIDKRVLAAWRRLPAWGDGFFWDRSDQAWVGKR